MHSSQIKLNKIKSKHRSNYVKKLFSAWDNAGRPPHRIPRLRIIDDAIIPVLESFGINPRDYYNKLKRQGFPVQYKLVSKIEEEEKRKEIKERKKHEKMLIAEMDLELKIIDGLICPFCLKSLNGAKFHPSCNATYKQGIIQKMNNNLSKPKKSRRNFSIKR